MFFARRTFAWTLTAAVLVAAPMTARAQPAVRSAEGSSTSRGALLAERQHVRGELERVNAEIDALKRSGRGLREDYRLRERLADAEALARRLTDLDARLGVSHGAATALPAPGDEPRALPADGPTELDAKADILADQARRLAARADVLLDRAHDLKARQTLRRRVGQMEHDPFSPLEGSKRRAMAGAATAGAFASAPVGKPVPAVAPGIVGPPGAIGGGTSTPSANTPGGEQATGTPSPAIGVGASLAPGARTDNAPPAGPQTPSVGTPGGVAVASPTTAPTPTSGATSDNTALSVQLRDLLDATTLAEIQHLEATGGASASTDALERAGAALKARAERLRQQAAALRASEHPRAR
jgi:hypothetical protein